jgi:hypothetical protein
VKACHTLKVLVSINNRAVVAVMSGKIHDLVQAHLAVVALSESTIISFPTRRQLQALRGKLEEEIIALMKEQPDETAAA